MSWVNCSRKKNGKLVTDMQQKIEPQKNGPFESTLCTVHVWICYRRKGATDWDWDMCRSRSESVKNEGFSRFMTNLVIQKAGTKSVLHPCQKKTFVVPFVNETLQCRDKSEWVSMTGVFPTNLTNNMKKDMDAGLSSIVRSQNMYFDSRTGLVKASKGQNQSEWEKYRKLCNACCLPTDRSSRPQLFILVGTTLLLAGRTKGPNRESTPHPR